MNAEEKLEEKRATVASLGFKLIMEEDILNEYEQAKQMIEARSCEQRDADFYRGTIYYVETLLHRIDSIKNV